MESSSLKLKGSSLKKKTHFFFIYNKRFDSTPSQSKSTSFAIYISHAHPSDDTNRETRRLATHSHCGHCSTCTPIYWFTAAILLDSFVVSILGGSVRNVTNALTNENVFCYLFVLLFDWGLHYSRFMGSMLYPKKEFRLMIASRSCKPSKRNMDIAMCHDQDHQTRTSNIYPLEDTPWLSTGKHQRVDFVNYTYLIPKSNALRQ